MSYLAPGRHRHGPGRRARRLRGRHRSQHVPTLLARRRARRVLRRRALLAVRIGPRRDDGDPAGDARGRAANRRATKSSFPRTRVTPCPPPSSARDSSPGSATSTRARFGMDPAALERCDFSRVLAVVTANLYGIPNALPDLERIARERGVYLLDDAAQSLGARLGGRAVGTFGDAGLYSFDKGKIICTIQGGADGRARVARSATRSPHGRATCRRARPMTSSATPSNYPSTCSACARALRHHPPPAGPRARPHRCTSRDTRSRVSARLQLRRRARLLPPRRRARTRTRRANAATLARGAARHSRNRAAEIAAERRTRVRALSAARDGRRSTRARSSPRSTPPASAPPLPIPIALADVPEVAARLPASDRAVPGARTLAAQHRDPAHARLLSAGSGRARVAHRAGVPRMIEALRKNSPAPDRLRAVLLGRHVDHGAPQASSTRHRRDVSPRAARGRGHLLVRRHRRDAGDVRTAHAVPEAPLPRVVRAGAGGAFRESASRCPR